MPENRSSIYQFGALEWLEQELNKGGDGRDRALEDIRTRESKRDAVPTDGNETGLGVPTGYVGHFLEHWMSGEYWPSIGSDTIRDRLAEGFHDAIAASKECDLPIVPVWVRANEDADSRDFRVDHVVTQHAVVVAIVTPQPNR